jgi:lipopolysaccharide export LptBFGC system permease protein LptF
MVGTYVLKIPSIITELLPLSMVVGVALAIAGFKARGEWDALAAVGISPFEISIRFMFLPAVAAGLLYLLSNFVAPWCLTRAAARLMTPSAIPVEGGSRWVRYREWIYEADEEGRMLTAISLFREDGRLERFQRLTTPSSDGNWRKWREDTGWKVTENGAPETPNLSSITMGTPLGTLPGAALPAAALRSEAAKLRGMGLADTPLEAEWALRMVKTFATLLIPLITFWICHVFGGKSAAVHVSRGIFLTVAYWLLSAVLWNGVYTGAWPKYWLAVGAPLLFFLAAAGTVSIYLLLYRRRYHYSSKSPSN